MANPKLIDVNPVRSLLVALAACLKNQIEDPSNGVDRPCVITVIPGETAIPEYQGNCSSSNDPKQKHRCGLAWVRLISAYPSTGVNVASVTPGNCGATLGFDINIGITRCFDPQGARTGPDEADIFDNAITTIADMLVMRKAIQCCTELPGKDYVLGAYTPIGPLGGMVGGSWTLSAVI